MRRFLKLLAVLGILLMLFGLYDTVVNGLFEQDGYRAVTEQMKDVMSE